MKGKFKDIENSPGEKFQSKIPHIKGSPKEQEFEGGETDRELVGNEGEEVCDIDLISETEDEDHLVSRQVM